MSSRVEPIDLANYRSVVFDCDGVILDSNKLKTQAFHDLAGNFGPEVANALVEFHLQNAGASRYFKFAYLLKNLLLIEPTAERIKELADQFACRIAASLRTCKIADGLPALRSRVPEATWMVVSGSDQAELRQLFSERKLAVYFDGGIFGSPDNKDVILSRELESGRLSMPALFIGDSRYDHEAAVRAGFDFVFVSNWTEFSGWRDYVASHQLRSIPALGDLANSAAA